MNNHHHPPPPTPPPPPPPPALNANWAPQIFTHAASIFFSHPIAFLSLAAHLFLFRANVEAGGGFLIHFIDNEPSVKALLSSAHASDQTDPYSTHGAAAFHHRRHSPFRSNPKPPPNGSFVVVRDFNPRLGFLNPIAVDNGIRVYDIVQSDPSLKILKGNDNDNDDELNEVEKSLESNDNDDGLNKVENNFESNDNDNENEMNKVEKNSFQSLESSNNNDELDNVKNSPRQEGDDEAERVADWQSVIKGLDSAALYHLTRTFLITYWDVMRTFFITYGYILIGYLVLYSCALGIVFVVVVNHFLRKYQLWQTVLGGSLFGLIKASRFVVMKWWVRDTFSLLLGLWYFGKVVKDGHSIVKIFMRLKLVPYSLAWPWVQGFDKETAGFLFAWLMLDMVVEFVFTVYPWVAIADPKRTWGGIVKDGSYLLLRMFGQGAIMKCLEFMVCGEYMSMILTRDYGQLFAMAFQSVAEVYFMVASLLFYFAVRSKDAISHGRTFGLGDLEGFMPRRRS